MCGKLILSTTSRRVRMKTNVSIKAISTTIDSDLFLDFLDNNTPIQAASYKYDVLSLWDLGEGESFNDRPELMFVPGYFGPEWCGKSTKIKTKIASGTFEGKEGSWYLNAKNFENLPFTKS